MHNYRNYLYHGADVTAKDAYGQTPERVKLNYHMHEEFCKFADDFGIKFRKNTKTGREYQIYEGLSINKSIASFNNSIILSDTYLGNAINIWRAYPIAPVNNIAAVVLKKLNEYILGIVAGMQAADPRLKSRVMSVGSAYEGTKIIAPNEFDFDVVLEEFSHAC